MMNSVYKVGLIALFALSGFAYTAHANRSAPSQLNSKQLKAAPRGKISRDIGTIQTLVLFNGRNGGNPTAGLIQGKDGNFYGTTSFGGTSQFYGTVFKLTPTRVLTTLVNFNNTNGEKPEAGLIQGTDSNFYGTTRSGFNTTGTVFKVTPTGTLTRLVSFKGSNGSSPTAELIQAKDGNFYGTTQGGGGTNSSGTVFKVTPTGQLTTLVRFNNRNGAVPTSRLVQGRDGNLYGTTLGGGSSGAWGTVFKVTLTGALTTLVNFNYNNGGNPQAGLALGRDGNLYGTTSLGGTISGVTSGNGTIFKVTPSGVFTSLFSFNGTTTGAFPHTGLTLGTDGSFYGTTQGGGSSLAGTVFRVTPTGQLTTLANFNSTNGATPDGELLQGRDGSFYGTTKYGGNRTCLYGCGTVFKLVIP